MILFITALIICIAFFIASIILAFKTYKRKKKNKKIIYIDEYKRKNENRLMLLSVLGVIFSIFGMIYTLLNSVPVPIIYPLDNEARVYNDTAKVMISKINFPFFHTYYSLDGRDPEDGYIYEDDFTITKTTTVCAKTKFLIFWSEPYKSTFRFESVQNITVNNVNNNTDEHTTVKDFFTYVILTLFLLIVLVLTIRGELDKE